MSFTDFVRDVQHRAASLLSPELTVEEVDHALHDLCHTVIHEHGGVQNLLAAQPGLLEVEVMSRSNRDVRLVADILTSLAEDIFKTITDEIRTACLESGFEGGLTEGIKKTLNFVLENGEHARGVVTPSRVTEMQSVIDGMESGDISSEELATGILASWRILKHLSLPGIDRTTDKFGGRETVMSNFVTASKLMIICNRRGDRLTATVNLAAHERHAQSNAP